MPQSGTVALMFTDLVNSTAVLEQSGDESGANLFQAHHKLLSEAIVATGGDELEWLGDGVLAAFSSTADAVRRAIAIQQNARRPIAGMHELVRWIVSTVARRLRSRTAVELENLALRHQLHFLRRQRPGRPRLFVIDRLLWIWLYRIWPRCLDAMVLVKPATVVQWHREGFRLFWRWRSRSGRP